MEEQPHEQPQDEPTNDSDGGPKIFGNINTTIAGVTGLLVALGGLAATWDKFFGDKPATEQRAAASTAPAEADKAPAETAEAAGTATSSQSEERPKIYTGDLYADGKFEGGAMSLKYDGENWILTADQRYVYEPLASSNKDQIRAYNADYGSYLRWPVGGGQVEESLDNKANWSSYAKVTASEPSPER
jgi:hypothetical protein